MLKGISPLLSPRLLATLCRMGHGEEIVLADAHFPGTLAGPLVLRADGVAIAPLLAGILPLFELDAYVDDPLVMMKPVAGDTVDEAVARDYRRVVDEAAPGSPAFVEIERDAFYERARRAACVLVTGETRKYGNLILKKGVTPI
ncbi:MAG: L-fucose mutarotase [Planctomycetota bacterium]